MAEVLIIDDDASICSVLTKMVRRIDHNAECCYTLEEGYQKAASGIFDAVFLDVRLPDGNGLDLLKKIKAIPMPPEVIIITGAGDPDGAEIAITNGAWDYLEKPFSPKKVILSLKRVLQYRDNLRKTQKPTIVCHREGIIGNSASLTACLEKLSEAAKTQANVLISGETGTGKEIFARALHRNSDRAHRNFVTVDCAALPETLVESYLFGYEKGAFTGAEKSKEGLIKQADGGTLFLDEAGELTLPLQKAFLRVLQERQYRPIGAKHEVKSNFRLVAATNKDLEQMAAHGTFRRDLLYRLRTISIELPPLRQRLSDIHALVNHYCEKICRRYDLRPKGISPDFLDILTALHWPGNVRELINTVESAISKAQNEPILFPAHLPKDIRIQAARASVSRKLKSLGEFPDVDPDVPQGSDAKACIPSFKDYRESIMGDAEKKYVLMLMKRTGGDIQEACRVSNLGRTRLYNLLKKHGITRNGTS